MHEGHRQRLISKVKTADALYEHELMEILLFNACPRKDVNAIAHGLISAFGSLNGVLNADAEELVKVNGVGVSTAQYLVCLGKCLNRSSEICSFAEVRSTSEFKQFISMRMLEIGCGLLELCLLDKDGRIRRICSFSGGISLDELLKLNCVYKPYGIFAARYGSCSAVPAAEDDAAVMLLARACDMSGVRFYDYCIACKNSEIYSYFVADRLHFAAGL